MLKKEQNPIYKHTHLDTRIADRLQPLLESAFKDEFSNYDQNPSRKAIAKERSKFIAEQYANRCRIAKNMGVNPLNEDAQIFGSLGNMGKLFESVSMPGNIIGMGEVSNPDPSNIHAGGTWNSAYKAGSGDIPSYVFGLQSHLPMHCVGFDLIPTIAVDTPKIVLQYVDTVYGGGKFDDSKNLPSFLELGNSIFTRSWIKTKGLKRATSEIVLVASDNKALKARFMFGSTVKAALIVEIISTGTATFADSTWTFSESTEHSVKDVVDAINKTIASAKVYISVSDAGTALVNMVTLDYASATRTNIAEAASNNNTLGGMSRAQHEKGPKHKLNIIAMDKQTEVVGLEIEADTTNIQIKDFAAMGINTISMLYTGVQNQLVQALDEAILDHLYALGVQHAVQAYESQGINHSLFIGAPSETELEFSTIDVKFEDMLGNDVRSRMGKIKNSIVASGYENHMTHMDRMFSRILRTAEFIHQQNRIGSPDFIVFGGDLAAAAKKNVKFIACPVTNTLSDNPELSYSGTLFETLNVYKNPRIAFDDPRILIGRRGNDTDPGAKFLAYDLAASRQIIAEASMSEKIRVWSRFKIEDIGFYPELNYYTLVAINSGGFN